MSKPDREVLLDREHSVLSIRRQCQILSLCRSEVYRRRPQPDPNELLLMRRLDELYTAHPFLGSRRLTALLRFEGCQVNRKRVQRLMRHMGIAALGPKPRTTKPAPGHKIYPYLLRDITIDRPNRANASSSASTQKELSIVFESLQESTARLAQSITATR